MAATTVEGMNPEALFAHMAELVLTPALPVAYPDIAFTPLAGPYLRVYFIPNGTERLFIGNGEPNLHQGILHVTVVFPAGQGSIKPNDVAGRAHCRPFRGSQSATNYRRLYSDRQAAKHLTSDAGHRPHPNSSLDQLECLHLTGCKPIINYLEPARAAI